MFDASEENNICISAVSNCCNGRVRGTFVGIFRFSQDSLDKYLYDNYYHKDGSIKICAYDIDGNITNEYNSFKELADILKTTKTTISRYIKSHKYIENIGFLFKKNDKFDNSLLTYPKIRKVNVYDLDNNFLYQFDNASETGRQLNIDPSSISKCCLNKINHCKNYIFKYA